MARAAILGCLLAVVTAACSPEEGRPPDLLLVTMETLRADHVSGDGPHRASTPNLDALAARGTSLAEAITPMPRTTPALASLSTGLWPQHHGSREVGDPMTAGTTLAEVLAARGYRTAAVVANPSAGREQHLDRGFHRFVGGSELLDRYADQVQANRPAPPGGRGLGWAEVVNREALALASEVPADAPLFLWVFYFDPHFSYLPPSPWRDEVEAARCFDLYAYLGRHPERVGQVFYDRDGVARRALEDCRELYRATLAYTDEQVGALLHGLDEMGRLRGALTAFTADHGENFGEAGLYFEHGENVHDAALRVPLVMAGPGVAAGRVDRGSTSLVDVAPTLLSLLGVPGEERPVMDGLDLSPYLHPGGTPREAGDTRIVFAESASALWNDGFEHVVTGRAGGRVCVNGPRYSLCEETGEAPGVLTLHDHRSDPDLSRDLAPRLPEVVERLRRLSRQWPPESARERAARTPRFKLVQRPRLEGGYEAALYDLTRDAAEAEDVSHRYPAVAARLLEALEAWAAGIPLGPQAPRDPRLEEVLKSLGYVG